MKILLCSNYYPPKFVGGAELIAHAQAKQLLSMGNEVRVFAPLFDEKLPRFTSKTALHEGIAVTRYVQPPDRVTPHSLCLPDPGMEGAFAALLASYRPDVVHFHNIPGLSLRLLGLAKRSGARTAMTLHDHWGFCYKNTLLDDEGRVCTDFSRCLACRPAMADLDGAQYPWRFRQDCIHYMVSQMDWLITPSRYLADAYIKAGYDPVRFRVISNGIDTARFNGLTAVPGAGTVRFTFIGHLGRHKGLHVLFDAVEHLPPRDNWRLQIVGSGDLAGLCREKASSGALRSHIDFIGPVDNSEILSVYAKTDVFILPSVWPENQPVTITEAQACGIPVIASDNGGIPELIEPDRTGLLFPTGNAKALAEKMRVFLDNPALAARYGRTARERIQRNTFAANAKALLDVYRTPGGDPSLRPVYFVCGGGPVDKEVLKALEIIHRLKDVPPVRFLYQPWLDEAAPPVAAGYVVTGNSCYIKLLLTAIAQAAPLLVSCKNEEAYRFCRSESCGLYFENYKECIAAIAALVHNQTLASALGAKLARTLPRPGV